MGGKLVVHVRQVGFRLLHVKEIQLWLRVIAFLARYDRWTNGRSNRTYPNP